MSRVVAVKITDPKPCVQCERVMQINEWAQAESGGIFTCSRCAMAEEPA